MTEEFKTLLALASTWVEEQEQIVLRKGVSLSPDLLNDARTAGVARPERVRVLKVPQVPLPTHPVLAAVCESTKALSPRTWALSARYGILVRADRWGEREIVVHELVHTSQYEKLGSVQAFLQQYLQECFSVGYPQAPMEQEAIITAAKICAPKS